MPALEKLTSSRVEELFETVVRPLAPRIPRQRWQRAFEPRDWRDEEHFGYVLVDGGKMIGMLGTLFSRRSIDGRDVRFCNLHNWYVTPEHRASSLLLMRPVLALREHVVTDLTATDEVVAISRRLGFATIERTALLLPPLPPSPGRNSHEIELIDLTDQPDQADSALNATELRIFRDHQGIDCGHLLVRAPEGRCYLVYSQIACRWLPHCHIHHVSDATVFSRRHAAIRRRLLRDGGCYVALSSPLLGGAKLPLSIANGTCPWLVRSTSPPPTSLDSLYSEIPLSQLPLYPRPPRFLLPATRRLVRRWKNRASE
ncbi:MAG: hypothetical protein AB7I30_04380 [Isosphaeraceae bacterium]